MVMWICKYKPFKKVDDYVHNVGNLISIHRILAI